MLHESPCNVMHPYYCSLPPPFPFRTLSKYYLFVFSSFLYKFRFGIGAKTLQSTTCVLALNLKKIRLQQGVRSISYINIFGAHSIHVGIFVVVVPFGLVLFVLLFWFPPNNVPYIRTEVMPCLSSFHVVFPFLLLFVSL